MKKIIALILFIPILSIAQVNKNNVVFKDGVEWKNGIDIYISKCIKSMEVYGSNNSEDFCKCTVQNLASKFSSEEFFSLAGESIMSSDYQIEQANIFWNNNKIKSIYKDCVESYPDVFKSFEWNADDKMIEVVAEQHLQQIKAESIEAYNEASKTINWKPYSLCYARKLLSEFKMNDLMNLTQKQILRIQEIQYECIMQNLK